MICVAQQNTALNESIGRSHRVALGSSRVKGNFQVLFLGMVLANFWKQGVQIEVS